MQEFLTPTTLYLMGVASVTILIAIFLSSILFYIKAKNLVPHFEKLSEIHGAIAGARMTLEDLKAEKIGMLDDIAKGERTIAAANAAREWMKENASRVDALRKEIENLRSDFNAAGNELKRRNVELAKIAQEILDKNSELHAKRKDVDEESRKANELRGEIVKLEGQASVARSRVEDLEKKLENIKSECEKEYEQQCERLRKCIQEEEDLEKKLLSLKNEIAGLGEQRTVLMEQKKNLESLVAEIRKEMEEERREAGKLRSEIAKLEGQANAARTSISELEFRAKGNEDRWHDLDREIFENAPVPKDDRHDEIKYLRLFMDVLREKNIMFNERTIKAFHTGLKCVEHSPLVVLAGISGTGKSLLPQLYASAFGMNFLGVAVQPRWDSPQDMFGFYNYMEGRYKATELLRLLWQFDSFNNANAKEKYRPSLPLNLVLLDEMNLARVEYYFSDLLSKLEARRGLDFNDDASRRKAEIEIECNASAANAQTRRLFVNYNTFFVGTMNEDESTQALSDKVLDRANVLRFGRPKELNAKPDIAGFYEKWASGQTSFANWKSWQNEKPDRIAKMQEILKGANEVLETVGRPFAHRVWQSMKSYVSFYPGDSPKDLNAAIADQIEMKILPKLNGVELDAHGFSEVKNKFSDIINEVKDEDLAKAFEVSCNTQQNTFFRWRGVLRNPES
jgi:predicted  nucleic acid-binding Zn-ribbon protein